MRYRIKQTQAGRSRGRVELIRYLDPVKEPVLEIRFAGATIWVQGATGMQEQMIIHKLHLIEALSVNNEMEAIL